jgi:hypothetical protein
MTTSFLIKDSLGAITPKFSLQAVEELDTIGFDLNFKKILENSKCITHNFVILGPHFSIAIIQKDNFRGKLINVVY